MSRIRIRKFASAAMVVSVICGCPGDMGGSGDGADLHYGMYRGRVVHNEDPLGVGRLRVIVPDALGLSEVWASPCLSSTERSLASEGKLAAPPVGAEVYVTFEAGDLARPVWLGFLWPDPVRPE